MKLSKYYSYIIIGVLFPVFLCFIVVGERRNKRLVENINVSQANPGRAARLDAIKEKEENERLHAALDKHGLFDVVIDGQGKVRLQRAMAFARFLFSEYGKGDRIITRTAKTPGYKHEKIGFRGLEWGIDVSQIDDLVLFPSDETEIIRFDETEIRFDAVGRRRGDETKINVPLVIDSRLIGRFNMHGETIYIFYKNKLVGASIIMGGFPVYDKMPYCIYDTFGPLSYISSDGMSVWDGNVTDISLTFERSEFKGEMMHSYTINFTKSDDP